MAYNIFKNRSGLSQSEAKVQAYIQKNPNRIEMLTINKLAANAGTSVASVQRYCRTLGFSGYKEFKFAFVNSISKVEKEKNIGELSLNYLNKYQNIIDQMKSLDKSVLRLLVNSLISSSTNYCLGVYYSEIPARLLALELQDLGTNTFLADDYTHGEHILENASADSTIVVFSITGTNLHYQEFWGEAIEHCNNTFLITLNPDAELSSDFKHTIVLPGEKLSQQMPFDPQTIPTLFVELLIQEVYQETISRNTK